MSHDVDDEDFKLGMLLNQSVYIEYIGKGEALLHKLSNDEFEIYLKNNQVLLIVDNRNPNMKAIYFDVHTAYNKVFHVPHTHSS